MSIPSEISRKPIFDLSCTANVPCNGCTACCHSAVPVRPEWGDKRTDYTTVAYTDPHTGAPVLILKQTADGTCIYLREGGCSIYEKRPAICRSFDCRTFYRVSRIVMNQMVMNGAETIRIWPAMQAVLEAGKARSQPAGELSPSARGSILNGNLAIMSNKLEVAPGADSATATEEA